jgi:hypothetical protein
MTGAGRMEWFASVDIMFLKRTEIDSDSGMEVAQLFLTWQATTFQSRRVSTGQLQRSANFERPLRFPGVVSAAFEMGAEFSL